MTLLILNAFGKAYDNIDILNNFVVNVEPVTVNPLFSLPLAYVTSGITKTSVSSSDQDVTLSVKTEAKQESFFTKISAFSINNSRVVLGSGKDTITFNVNVNSDSAPTTAVAIDKTGFNPRQNNDLITISAKVSDNNPSGVAIGIRDSFIGMGNGEDNIYVSAQGPKSFWAQRSVISAGQDESNDVITGIGFAEDIVVRGWGGDDIIQVGNVTSTGSWKLKKEWIAKGTRDRVFTNSIIDGGSGYDTLIIQEKTQPQFMNDYQLLDSNNNVFTFKNTPGVIYQGFERIMTNDSISTYM
jgi:hypothetical protein